MNQYYEKSIPYNFYPTIDIKQKPKDVIQGTNQLEPIEDMFYRSVNIFGGDKSYSSKDIKVQTRDDYNIPVKSTDPISEFYNRASYDTPIISSSIETPIPKPTTNQILDEIVKLNKNIIDVLKQETKIEKKIEMGQERITTDLESLTTDDRMSIDEQNLKRKSSETFTGDNKRQKLDTSRNKRSPSPDLGNDTKKLKLTEQEIKRRREKKEKPNKKPRLEVPEILEVSDTSPTSPELRRSKRSKGTKRVSNQAQ